VNHTTQAKIMQSNLIIYNMKNAVTHSCAPFQNHTGVKLIIAAKLDHKRIRVFDSLCTLIMYCLAVDYTKYHPSGTASAGHFLQLQY